MLTANRKERRSLMNQATARNESTHYGGNYATDLYSSTQNISIELMLNCAHLYFKTYLHAQEVQNNKNGKFEKKKLLVF